MMARAHEPFAELAEHGAALRDALPPRWPGYHLVPLCGGRLTLHLHYADVSDTLPTLDFAADAWFLDGFAPARNPRMWQADILKQVGRLTRAGGTLASFTAAGDVRRGLEAAGFAVERVPGYGRKRQMIRGIRQGQAVPQNHPPRRIAVIGGGVAGASVVAGLRRRGAAPVILESAARHGTAASGNRMALQSPRLTVDHNTVSRMSASCLSWASRLADACGATVGAGVAALDSPVRMAERHAIFRTQHWPDDLLQPLQDVHCPKGIPAGASGLFYARGRAIRPDRLLAGLIGDVPVRGGQTITALQRGDTSLRLTSADGQVMDFDAVVLANGADILPLLTMAGMTPPIGVSFGQVSHVPSGRQLATGVSFGGYLTPALDGLHDLGATFTHAATDADDAVAVAAGHAHNLGLLPDEWRRWLGPPDSAGLGARIGRRASLPDRRPLAGRVGPGIWTLGGLGARGFTLAPLLGDMLAADIMGRPVPMPRDQRQGVQPGRYADIADKGEG